MFPFIIAIIGLILAFSLENARKKKNPSPYKRTHKQKKTKAKNIYNSRKKTNKDSIFSQKNKTTSKREKNKKRNGKTKSYNTSQEFGENYLSNEIELNKIESKNALLIKTDEKIEVELLSEIKDEFLENPKKAFIFSEIFNRKY